MPDAGSAGALRKAAGALSAEPDKGAGPHPPGDVYRRHVEELLWEP
jgi:hypothetical protein